MQKYFLRVFLSLSLGFAINTISLFSNFWRSFDYVLPRESFGFNLKSLIKMRMKMRHIKWELQINNESIQDLNLDQEQ